MIGSSKYGQVAVASELWKWDSKTSWILKFIERTLSYKKRDEQENIFKSHDVKWLRYSSEHFGEINFKTTLEERTPFHTLCIRRRGIENRELFIVKPITDKPVPINP